LFAGKAQKYILPESRCVIEKDTVGELDRMV
jgi:hypothetical protein